MDVKSNDVHKYTIILKKMQEETRNVLKIVQKDGFGGKMEGRLWKIAKKREIYLENRDLKAK